MIKLRLALAAFAALFAVAPAIAQVSAVLPVTCNPNNGSCVQATPVTNPNGTNIGGTATSDATAANQLTQITAAQLTNTTLGAVTASPTSNTIGDRLKTINNTLGTPLQAGGTVVVTGVATEATLAAQNAKLPASLGAKIGALSLSVVPNSDTAFPVTDNGGSLTVDGTVAATQSGAWLNGIKGADGSNIVSSSNGFYILGTKLNDGSQSSTGGTHLTMGGVDTGTNVYRPLLVDSSGRANVTDGSGVANSLTVDNATASNFNAQVVGAAANAAAVSGNPVLVAGSDGTSALRLLTGNGGALLIGSSGNSNTAGVTPTGADTVANTSLASLRTYAVNSVFNGTTWDRQRGDTTGTYVVGGLANLSTSTTNPFLIAARYNSTLPTYTNGQLGELQMGTRGALSVQLMGADNATGASMTGTAADATNNSINGLKSTSFCFGFNGTTWDRCRMVQNALDSNGTGFLGAGVMAQLDDTSPGTVTENQFSTVRMSPNRALLVKDYASDAESWSYAAASGGITNTTTAVTIKAAAGGSLRNYVTSCQLDAGTLGAATEFAIRDGAGGTVVWRTNISTAGITRTMTFPVPLRGTANTLLEIVTLTASITGAVYANCQGYSAL